MNNGKVTTFCSNCGAPTTSEVCPYCKASTGIETEYANMEYPVIECKEGTITFWNVFFPMIFAFGFGSGGFMTLFLSFGAGSEDFLPLLLFGLVFGTIGVVSFITAIKPIMRFFSIKKNGKDIEATVYGYMDDNVLLNGNPAQIVKLLVNTYEGPRFILYQLGDIKRPYKINSRIKLKVYKDIFLIDKDKEYYF